MIDKDAEEKKEYTVLLTNGRLTILANDHPYYTEFIENLKSKHQTEIYDEGRIEFDPTIRRLCITSASKSQKYPQPIREVALHDRDNYVLIPPVCDEAIHNSLHTRLEGFTINTSIDQKADINLRLDELLARHSRELYLGNIPLHENPEDLSFSRESKAETKDLTCYKKLETLEGMGLSRQARQEAKDHLRYNDFPPFMTDRFISTYSLLRDEIMSEVIQRLTIPEPENNLDIIERMAEHFQKSNISKASAQLWTSTQLESILKRHKYKDEPPKDLLTACRVASKYGSEDTQNKLAKRYIRSYKTTDILSARYDTKYSLMTAASYLPSEHRKEIFREKIEDVLKEPFRDEYIAVMWAGAWFKKYVGTDKIQETVESLRGIGDIDKKDLRPLAVSAAKYNFNKGTKDRLFHANYLAQEYQIDDLQQAASEGLVNRLGQIAKKLIHNQQHNDAYELFLRDYSSWQEDSPVKDAEDLKYLVQLGRVPDDPSSIFMEQFQETNWKATSFILIDNAIDKGLISREEAEKKLIRQHPPEKVVQQYTSVLYDAGLIGEDTARDMIRSLTNQNVLKYDR